MIEVRILITRCAGISTGMGFLVGDGYSGKSKELDDIVKKEAEILQELYHKDVEIRFNHDRESGGAWVVDGKLNCSIGLCAAMGNKTLFYMPHDEKAKMPLDEYVRLAENHDMIIFQSNVDIKNTINSCNESEVYPTSTSVFKDFDTLEAAVNYLRDNVKGLR